MELNDLLMEISKICLIEQERMKHKQRKGDCFNVFNTLGLRSNEVRLHSAFLAELLNPDGNHGLKDAMLKEFLAAIGLKRDYISNCNTNIVERYIGERTETTGGRIDIILEDGEYAIIIENKIYAIDQYHQLLRYNNYGKQRFPKGFKLIYLTLDGHEASKDSLGDNEIDYHCISYKGHILNWLSKCVMLAYDKPLVRETISQYITLIKQITGQDMNKDSSDKIDKLTNDGTYSNLSKREVLQISRQRAKLEKNLGSIADLTRLPSALFVIDVLKENIAVREANRLGIPVFAIVDTNSDPSNVDFVIPANDDATKSVEVILDACCGAIAEGLEERKAEKVDMEAAGENAPKGAGKKKNTKARMDKAEEEAINAAKAAAFLKEDEEA